MYDILVLYPLPFYIVNLPDIIGTLVMSSICVAIHSTDVRELYIPDYCLANSGYTGEMLVGGLVGCLVRPSTVRL